MPLPSLHPLPVNPTTGQQPLQPVSARGSGSGPPPASAAGGGGVNREVLKGLQDVVWSDDEDDPDCLLCAEPLDLSDLNFKPCQCGMQICQFCYNKLLSTDARCPGCRRPYDAQAVVFQPVDWEEVKRAKEKKTKRTKTIKQLTSMGRRHLLGVRVVMKNMVYVIGMKLPAPGDEAIPILRSNEYFGQYGKISKLYIRDRTVLTSASIHTLDTSPDAGIYIVYVRREDAARAISALDGIPAPQGAPGQVLKASYGTTRYCDAFLKGMKCDNSGCTCLHEWGGDSDCFTKDDMEIALTKPAEYDARQKQAVLPAPSLTLKSTWPKPASTDDFLASTGLPNTASWAKPLAVSKSIPNGRPTPIGVSRPIKVPSQLIPLNSNAAFPLPTPSPITPAPIKEKEKRKPLSFTTMARGKSTDSSQSNTTNSAQTSPKKKVITLSSTSIPKQPTPVNPPPLTPPPGLSVTILPETLKTAPLPPLDTPLDADEPLEESISADSEAGPSSASPAPQTPSRSDILPPPLTSEPYIIHSPYEEPRHIPFPASDPEFAYVLGLDDLEIKRQAAVAGYKPSPFSRTLVGLAELGVLAPELPDILDLAETDGDVNGNASGFTGSFQPFDGDLSRFEGDDTSSQAGPSRITLDDELDAVEEVEVEVEMEMEGPRMTSRFDFARPGSRSTGRGQSPFTMRDRMRDGHGHAEMWGINGNGNGQGHGHGTPSSSSRGFGVDHGFGESGQHANVNGNGSGHAGGSNAWTPDVGDSPYMPSRRGEHPHAYGREKGMRLERDDYDPAMLQYGQTPLSSLPRQYTPDTPAHSQSNIPLHHNTHNMHDDSHHHYLQHQQHPSQHTPQHHGYDARAFQGYHQQQQQRAQSPTPLGSHGYRRW